VPAATATHREGMAEATILLRPAFRSATVSAFLRVAGTSPSSGLGLAPPIVLRDTPAVTDVAARGTRVIVADDDVLMREGLASLLERGGYEVVGQAGDGSELTRLVGDHQPDLS